MALHFVVERERGEETYPLKDGMLIGRSNADINVSDPVVSTKHATVRKDAQGLWVLLDMDSRNGLTYEGRKVKSLLLKHGVNFMIGKQLFQTIEIENTSHTISKSIANTALEKWHEKIARMAENVSKSAPQELRNPDLFSKTVNLNFVNGVQTGMHWVITYGPRSFGSEVSEFTILEENAPGICFSLTNDTHGISFKTDHPAKVLLNGKPTKTDLVKSGDEIFISQTKIHIGLE